MTKEHIEKLLKVQLSLAKFTIEEKQYAGWSAKLNDYYEIENSLLSNWKEFHSQNIRAFAGNSVLAGDTDYFVPLFFVPKLPTIDIVSFSRTGTHNNSPENWKSIKQALTSIFNEHPYEIQFADAAGLHATFVDPPSSSDSVKIAAKIVEINLESYEVMDEDPASFIESTGRFKLWWD